RSPSGPVASGSEIVRLAERLRHRVTALRPLFRPHAPAASATRSYSAGGRFHWLVWHGIFRVIARKAPSADGTEAGPVSALADEAARLREDAALSLPDVHSTELHRSGGVEEPAVTRVQDGEAGPLECRIEAEGPRAA